MNTFQSFLQEQRKIARPKSLRHAVALLEIESNPPNEAEIALVESFAERQLSAEERKAEIAASIARDFGVTATG